MSQNSLCWIHLTDLTFFLTLGANPFERNIGQNIKIHLSLQIPYENTCDKLENTIDYGLVYKHLESQMQHLNGAYLLEYLAEQLLLSIGSHFSQIAQARIVIEKGYVPLPHFPGKVRIEAEKSYWFMPDAS